MHLRSVVVCFIMPAGILGSLSGCALYSETRDKQAQEAVKAWEQVDLGAQVAVPRKNMAALLKQQLDLADEFGRAKRDNLARSIATGSDTDVLIPKGTTTQPPIATGTIALTLIDPVHKALTGLAGSPDAAKKWTEARAATLAARRNFAEAQRGLRWLGVEVPDCAALKAPGLKALIAAWPATPAQSSLLRTSVAEMTAICGDADFAAMDGVSLGGTLQQTREKVQLAAAALEQQRALGLMHRNSYRAALAEYEAAAAVKGKPDEYRDKVAAAAGKMKTAAAALDKLDDAFSIRFLSEQKRDALDDTVAAVLDRAEDGTLPENASRATVALAVFPALLDKAKLAFADAKQPGLVPLLLQKDLEQIKADAASRDVEAQLVKIATLEQLIEAQSRQAQRLLQARDALADATGSELASRALAPSASPSEKKMRLWRATAYYLDASGRLDAETSKFRYKLDALDQERALGYAESSILQWKTLIDSNVGQMAQFGASGIKASHVAGLLNSASLLAIAIGTN